MSQPTEEAPASTDTVDKPSGFGVGCLIVLVLIAFFMACVVMIMMHASG